MYMFAATGATNQTTPEPRDFLEQIHAELDRHGYPPLDTGPGADIPDEVVEAAADAINAVDIGQMGHREIQLEFARAALAAADAKRAELEVES